MKICVGCLYSIKYVRWGDFWPIWIRSQYVLILNMSLSHLAIFTVSGFICRLLSLYISSCYPASRATCHESTRVLGLVFLLALLFVGSGFSRCCGSLDYEHWPYAYSRFFLMWRFLTMKLFISHFASTAISGLCELVYCGIYSYCIHEPLNFKS